MSRGLGVPSVTVPPSLFPGDKIMALTPTFTRGKLRQKGKKRPKALRLSLNQLLASCSDISAGESFRNRDPGLPHAGAQRFL